MAAAAAALVVPAALYLSTGAGLRGSANLVTNSGFESGSLSGWTCDSGTATVVTSPVHSGSYALGGTPPRPTTLSARRRSASRRTPPTRSPRYVEGSYVYLGDTGGNDTWTPSATSWQQLSLSITTGLRRPL